MKAKLFKKDNDYCLYNESGETIAASWANVTGKKLSQSNCDEIFGAIDVEKLADDSSQEFLIKPIESPIFTFGYEEGFEKAMELNKDKVFTLEDMKNAIRMARRMNSSEGEFDIDALKPYSVEDFYKNSVNKYSDYEIMQSLQQPTEIEVEVVMETISDGLDEMAQPQYAKVPKLDSEGCLILKKI
jgi:hypothetical protein